MIELNDVKSAEQAKTLANFTNFWVDSGNEVLFFFIDANVAVLIPLLSFKFNQYTVGIFLLIALFMFVLKKRDVTFFEFLARIRIRIVGQIYRRRK